MAFADPMSASAIKNKANIAVGPRRLDRSSTVFMLWLNVASKHANRLNLACGFEERERREEKRGRKNKKGHRKPEYHPVQKSGCLFLLVCVLFKTENRISQNLIMRIGTFLSF
jgi:hypothetical protein